MLDGNFISYKLHDSFITCQTHKIMNNNIIAEDEQLKTCFRIIVLFVVDHKLVMK
jgi:hypothetical protein